MNGIDAPPAAVDIDLDKLESPGSDWQRLEERPRMYVHRKTGRLLLVPDDRANPPSQWAVLP